VKVLVADDSSDNRQLITDILEGLELDLVMAVDGPMALALTRSEMPDLVLLDVTMPGMSGFDVCALLKSDTLTSHIPIIILTALNEADNRVRGLSLGADDYLTKPFNARELIQRVKTRLRSKSQTDELKATQELVRRTFERFVSPSVVEQLLQDPTQVVLGGKLQEVTVLFTDLEGFTRISEHTEPEKLLAILNHYHTLVVATIREHSGTVDKFIGDGVMALFNTPLAQEDHALRAVTAALHIRYALSEFQEQFEPLYRMPINFGIHTGMAVVGNVGAPEIMDFTAVGDTVNLAARLQQSSHQGQILISQATYQQVADTIEAEYIGDLNVKGRQGAVSTYQVQGFSNE
jgi:adenylate cyclase